LKEYLESFSLEFSQIFEAALTRPNWNTIVT